MDQAKIADHSVHFYYQFRYDFQLDDFDNAKFRQAFDDQIKKAVVDGGPDEPSKNHKLLARMPGRTIWQPLSGGHALGDLEPSMRAILGGEAKICLAYKFAAPDLVSEHICIDERDGKKITSKKNWKVQYTDAAKRRCGLDCIEINIYQIRLFVFRSGVALLEISLKYRSQGDDKVPQAVLLESNYALTHDYAQVKCSAGAIHGGDLRELAAALVPPVPGYRPQAIKGRVNTYTIAKLAGRSSLGSLRRLGMRLAQRQTSDYQLLDANARQHCLTPFLNICHAAAVEGGASLVAATPKQTSSFTESFVGATGKNTYLPIYIYQLHNHYWLMNHLRGIPSKDSAGELAEDVYLEQKLESIVDFRRYFQLSQISQISAHNSFHELWQSELKAEERFRHLNEAARTIGDHTRERRTRWVSHVTATVAGYLLGSGLTENLSRVMPVVNLPNLLLENLSDAAHKERLRQIAENWDLAILFAGLIGAAASLYLSWRFNRRAEY